MPITEFKGTSPYDTELFGVFQPLLGWKSKQRKEQVVKGQSSLLREVIANAETDRRLFNNLSKPCVSVVIPGAIDPRPPTWLDSRVIKYVLEEIIKGDLKSDEIYSHDKLEQAWGWIAVNGQNGKGEIDGVKVRTDVTPFIILPKIVIDESKLTGVKEVIKEVVIEDSQYIVFPKALAKNAFLKFETPEMLEEMLEKQDLVVYPRLMLTQSELEEAQAVPVEGTSYVVVKRQEAEKALVSSYSPYHEFAIASVISYMGMKNADLLYEILSRQRKPWEDEINFVDPLANFDPNELLAVLSPVGIIHLFREYFFELDTFLGPSVGHVWISPGGSVELVEVNTRRVLSERVQEILEERSQKTEITTTQQDELSEAIKEDNERSLSAGVSTSGGGGMGVWHAEASANLGLQSTRKLSQEVTHKYMRQQSEKLASEIRSSFKTTFRVATEVQDTSSRRYIVQNQTEKLVNYELRRKMRRVAVQVQNIGTQLCWVAYVESPGLCLGIGELVHSALPSDTDTQVNPPDAPVPLAPKETMVSHTFGYAVHPRSGGQDHGGGNHYVLWENAPKDKYGDRKVAIDGRINKKNEIEGDDDIIYAEEEFSATPPAANYTLAAVSLISIDKVNVEKDPPDVSAAFNVIPGKNKFTITLESVTFHDQPGIKFNLNLVWAPPDQTKEFEEYNKQIERLNEQTNRQTRAEYIKLVRERIQLAGSVSSRDVVDLRAEERSIIYQNLIRQLVRANEKQSTYITSELINAVFDIDKMLYFVAREWWQPRHYIKQQVGVNDTHKLTEDNVVAWGGIKEGNRPNYYITEDSEPAPMGSSLGWLVQLDGDSRRNAFLNSSWAKAVIPIRAGREVAALNWLKKAHIEGTEGLDALYACTEGEFPELTEAERDKLSIEGALTHLAEKISEENTKMEYALQAETLYEKGFDPMEGGFDATGNANEIFDQWIEVLPTDQVVALEYDPAAHL